MIKTLNSYKREINKIAALPLPIHQYRTMGIIEELEDLQGTYEAEKENERANTLLWEAYHLFDRICELYKINEFLKI